MAGEESSEVRGCWGDGETFISKRVLGENKQMTLGRDLNEVRELP